ncbi:cytochrome c-type biogenesis protein CcmH [Palleronia aestuarii]|uniref:Cytochrome c-type biogenesis protein n=1 Tax=Palleronia aestuarii TaxID=568105 RepID=A0A2W7NWR6_9RHOB|nr:cytochrome c-type biogenesis protein [Palleronia aestuarii]PZX17746.1 cytochrome c-type biogenesis protein CcmH [Palleronia aestuarii]
MRRIAATFALTLALAAPALAVQPDEMLDDPALEARARDISQNLRCLVCRNENIDESNADLARDLRLAVRERLMAGDSNAEAVEYLVDRYGEYVLLSPRADGSNLILWLAGPAMLLAGIGVAVIHIRRSRRTAEPEPLDEDEKARLSQLLRE